MTRRALLVSNKPTETTDMAGLGKRAPLDDGKLGVVAVRVDSARHAIGILRPQGILGRQAVIPVGPAGPSVVGT